MAVSLFLFHFSQPRDHRVDTTSHGAGSETEYMCILATKTTCNRLGLFFRRIIEYFVIVSSNVQGDLWQQLSQIMMHNVRWELLTFNFPTFPEFDSSCSDADSPVGLMLIAEESDWKGLD